MTFALGIRLSSPEPRYEAKVSVSLLAYEKGPYFLLITYIILGLPIITIV